MRGQEEQHHYGEYDYEFCGTDLPEEVETPGPRLVLLFNSGNKPAQGFKAKFTFETGEIHGSIQKVSNSLTNYNKNQDGQKL